MKPEHQAFSEMIRPDNTILGVFIWHRNDFHSGMSFVPEWSSYCVHMIKSTGLAPPIELIELWLLWSDQIRMRNLSQATRNLNTKHGLPFSIRNEPRFPVFSVYMIPEWEFH